MHRAAGAAEAQDLPASSTTWSFSPSRTTDRDQHRVPLSARIAEDLDDSTPWQRQGSSISKSTEGDSPLHHPTTPTSENEEILKFTARMCSIGEKKGGATLRPRNLLDMLFALISIDRDSPVLYEKLKKRVCTLEDLHDWMKQLYPETLDRITEIPTMRQSEGTIRYAEMVQHLRGRQFSLLVALAFVPYVLAKDENAKQNLASTTIKALAKLQHIETNNEWQQFVESCDEGLDLETLMMIMENYDAPDHDAPGLTYCDPALGKERAQAAWEDICVCVGRVVCFGKQSTAELERRIAEIKEGSAPDFPMATGIGQTAEKKCAFDEMWRTMVDECALMGMNDLVPGEICKNDCLMHALCWCDEIFEKATQYLQTEARDKLSNRCGISRQALTQEDIVKAVMKVEKEFEPAPAKRLGGEIWESCSGEGDGNEEDYEEDDDDSQEEGIAVEDDEEEEDKEADFGQVLLDAMKSRRKEIRKIAVSPHKGNRFSWGDGDDAQGDHNAYEDEDLYT